MANQTPPPWANITGITRDDFKHTNLTAAEYDGSARAGELVVDLTSYQLFIGNADGNLNIVGGGGGNGSPGGINHSIQFNNLGAFGGDTNLTYNTVTQQFGLLGTVNSNWIPSSNVTYSLGNSTNQWKELWVSGNTIYIDSVPLSVGANSSLTIDGNPIVTANASSNGSTNVNELTVSGNIWVENVNSSANVYANYFIGDGGFLTNISAGSNYANSNVAAYLPTNTSNVGANNISTTGNVTVGGTGAGTQLRQYNATGSQITFTFMSPQGSAPYATGSLISISGTGVTNLNGNYTVVSSSTTVVIVTSSFPAGSGFFFFPNQAYSALVSIRSISALGTITGGNLATGGTLNVVGNTTAGNINVGSSRLPSIQLLNYTASGTQLTFDHPSILPPPFNAGETVSVVGSGVPGLDGYYQVVSDDGTSLIVNSNFPTTSTTVLVGTTGTAIFPKLVSVIGNIALSGGNISTDGSVVGSYLYGDGSNITNLPIPVPTLDNTSVGDMDIMVYDGNLKYTSNATVDVSSGKLTAAYFSGDGGYLSNINGANITGGYGNSNVADYLPTYTGQLAGNSAYIGGNTPGDFYITQTPSSVSIGQFAAQSITVGGGGIQIAGTGGVEIQGAAGAAIDIGGGTTGNISFHNAISLLDATSSGTISASYLVGDGSNITNLPAGNYSNANVADYLANSSTTGNIFGGIITAADNVQSNLYLVGTSGGLMEFNSAVILAAQDSANGLSVAMAAGNATGTDGDGGTVALFAGTATGNGNPGMIYLFGETAVSGANLTVTESVTSDSIDANVATIVDIIASNSISAINITSGDANISGNIIASYLYGDGSNISNINGANITGAYGNSNVASYLPTYTGNLVSLTGNILTTADITAYGDIHSAGNLISDTNLFVTGTANISNSLNVFSTIAASGNITSDANLILAGSANVGSSLKVSGFTTVADMAATGNVNITGNITGSNITASGSATNMIRRAFTNSVPNTVVSLDNITARIGGSPAQLWIGTVTGNLTVTGQTQTWTGTANPAGQAWVNVPLSNSAPFAMSGAMGSEGYMAVAQIGDQKTGTGMWRITGMIGNISGNTYYCSIEKLV